jgi:membrane protease YdiL (CAAX protease family)
LPEKDEPQPSEPAPPHRFVLIAAAVELSLAPLGLLLARIWRGEPIPPLGFGLHSILLGAAAAIPPLALLFWLTSAPRKDWPPLRTIREKLRGVLGETLAHLATWHMALLALAAGVGEELLFRGALQPRVGLALTALVFGLLHALTPLYLVLAGIFGLYLGWLQARSGSLLVPILAHALYDAVALWVVRRELSSPESRVGPGTAS